MSRRQTNRGTKITWEPSSVFAALGDPTRLALVTELSQGRPRSIVQMTQGTVLTRQAVSKHLKILQRAGLVQAERHGRQCLFKFDPKPVDNLRDYLDRISRDWDEALGRLKDFLEK